MPVFLPPSTRFHLAPRRFRGGLPALLTGLTLHAALVAPVAGASWPMRQRDAANTGRADFEVPSNRRNTTFFDAIRWQKPSPGSPNEGRFSSGTMVFFDGAGPGGADLVVGGYHWPKGVQGMNRHTGKRFWHGNPDGGESIGENTPAFSASGTTLYVVNDATTPEHPLMAFSAAAGPAVFRHNGADVAPWKLGNSSPKVGPDGRIYAHYWNDRPHAASDNGTLLAHVWSPQSAVEACYSVPQIWQDTSRVIVVSGGRQGQVKAWDGSTGSELWSGTLPQGTDADATIDPATGKVYLPVGSDSIWVAGLDKDGNPLWGTMSKPVFGWQSGVNDPQRAQSAGCLAHDGLTYYFQTVSPNGQGKLYAINTTNGSLKWSFATGSRGWERTMSSPIITSNGVIVVGNNEGGTYFALLDNGGSATQLDTLVVAESGEARNSATVSTDGLLYLSGRWPWTTGNGDNDVPTQQAANLFTAFDLNAGVFGPVVPEITSHPVSQTIEPGSTATLSVGVAGNPLPTLQWYRGASGDTSQAVSGAVSATFTTPALTATTSYWVRGTNSEGSADSTSAVVTVRYAPEIAVEEPAGASLASGATSDFGSGPVGVASAPLAFTIRNTGSEALENLALDVTGSHAADFTVNPTELPTSLAPGGQTVLTVTFTPGAAGPRAAVLSMTSDDDDENPFLINLGGAGVMTVASAIDQPTLPVVRGGAAQWFGQTAVTHDGIDAARSGSIEHNQESWILTGVTGPGTLSFWWKVSSEGGYDFLEFYLDGVLQSGRISGEVDWQQKTYVIPEGDHGLRWRYVKDISLASGQDAGWVDQVVFTPPVPPQITTQPASQTIYNGAFATLTVAASGTPTLTFQWYRGPSGDTSHPLAGATAASFITPDLTQPATYWVRVSNAAGATDSDAAVILIDPTPAPLVQRDIAAALAAGQATVVTSTLDIGSSANIFDGSTSTLARTAAVNPMVVTLEFQQPLQLARSRIFFGAGPHNWKIETADTLADLTGEVGSFRLALGWREDASDQWHDRLFAAAPSCRFVRLTLQRMTGDNYVHLSEWQLFTGTPVAPVITVEPRSVILAAGEAVPPGALQVTATGSPPLSYRWEKFLLAEFGSSSLFPISVDPELSLGTAGPEDAGLYRVVVSNAVGSVISREVVVSYNASRSLIQVPEPLVSGGSVELLPAGIPGGWRFAGELRWRDSGEPISGLTVGSRKLVFKPVPGFRQPDPETLVVPENDFVLVSRSYVPAGPADVPGELNFVIHPASIASPGLPTAQRAQWRLAGNDEDPWLDSGATISGLPAGDYLVECKPLEGQEAPAAVRAIIYAGETTATGAAYPPVSLNPASAWTQLPGLPAVNSASDPTPYPCIGQVRSDSSEATGFVVADYVALTAASAVFDDNTLSMMTGLKWRRMQHRDHHEPVGVAPYSIVLMSGYAAQRASEATPGSHAAASLNLGLAALWVSDGQYSTGYLASDTVPHAWLNSSRDKKAVGYPTRIPIPSVLGKMHESAASNVPLAGLADGLYPVPSFEGGEGMAGAPLLVMHDDGKYYPAGVFLGGAGRAVARAIDSDVVRIVLLAQGESPQLGGTANFGVSMITTAFGAKQDPAAVEVSIGGAANSNGRWKLGVSGTPLRSGVKLGSLAPGLKRIYFLPVAGMASPGLADPANPGQSYVEVELKSGRLASFYAEYGGIRATPANQNVVAFSPVRFTASREDRSPLSHQWYHNGVEIEGAEGEYLDIPVATAASAGTYSVRAFWDSGSILSNVATLSVEPAPQSIEWAIAELTVAGLSTVDLAATATSGLPVTYQVVQGPGVIEGSRLVPTGLGLVVVQADQEGSPDYLPAPPVSRSFQFVPQSLESWRQENFSTTANTGDAADTADPDRDGQVNLDEYTAGTNPKNGADRFQVQSMSHSGTGFTVVVPGKAGRSYRLERRDSLVAGTWGEVGTIGTRTGDGPVEITDTGPLPGSAFYRVSVTIVAP